MKETLWTISYDIADDKKRHKACEILKDFGVHVQKSVFECHLSEKELKSLIRLLTPLIDPKNDSLRFYPVCEKCRRRIKTFGKIFAKRHPYLVV
ncbi:CRISPR-associated endonuclease Cas2 [Thermodesulfatator atlanticus]|uniref:CRISPR-associated endonuclease Cas2 n=1 Tax=Thermodesulfatator atlanticus TaxID=501497 RepID=UPI0003B48339|nr:CRISPR-associated endonuclease Cas2 [Thermodesulfatator atlanticus]